MRYITTLEKIRLGVAAEPQSPSLARSVSTWRKTRVDSALDATASGLSPCGALSGCHLSSKRFSVDRTASGPSACALTSAEVIWASGFWDSAWPAAAEEAPGRA